MPLYHAKQKSILDDPANTASKMPRPLQKPTAWALEGLKTFFPPDDPLGGMSPSSLEGAATPLISIYKDAAGVPSKALRDIGLGKFLNQAYDIGGNINEAALRFADRYPRVAAHINLFKHPTDEGFTYSPSGKANAFTRNPVGRVSKPIPVGITPTGLKYAEEIPYYADDMITHEGAHVAQGLGNHHFANMYQRASELTGHEYNPFEDAARTAADKAQDIAKGNWTDQELRHMYPPSKTLEGLAGVAEDTEGNIWRNKLIGTTEQPMYGRWTPRNERLPVSKEPPTPTAHRRGIGWWDTHPEIEAKIKSSLALKGLLNFRKEEGSLLPYGFKRPIDFK